MLHLTVANNKDGSIVRLSGNLMGEFVAEADRACAGADRLRVIDASQLQGADADGLAWLVAALDRGILITCLSGYLELRLIQLREQNCG